MYPPGIQIMNGPVFIGGSSFEFSTFEPQVQQETFDMAMEIGKILRKKGYRGYAGVDILVLDGNSSPRIYAIEINPRFTGSTGIDTKASYSVGAGTAYYHSILAFYADKTDLAAQFAKIPSNVMKMYAKIGEIDKTGRNVEGYNLTKPLDCPHYTYAKYQLVSP